MCNLYTTRKSREEVAVHFRIESMDASNAPEETYPGYPGLVVREQDGARVMDQPIFAWAGLWRVSNEWKPVYSGVMTDCNEAIRPVHNRMPVLLMPNEYDQWLNGSFDDALAFQSRCFPDNLIEMTRTNESWSKPRQPPASEVQTPILF